MFDEEFSLQGDFEAEEDERPLYYDICLLEDYGLAENGIPQF